MSRMVMKLLVCASGHPTPHDGRYLKAYDPTWLRIPHDDGLMIATLETTDKIEDAMTFESPGDLLECWRRASPNYPIREDGEPNRPLTAFTVMMEPAP